MHSFSSCISKANTLSIPLASIVRLGKVKERHLQGWDFQAVWEGGLPKALGSRKQKCHVELLEFSLYHSNGSTVGPELGYFWKRLQ